MNSRHSTTPDHALQQTASPEKRGAFGFVFLVLLSVGNLVILIRAWQDRSWGALWLAIIGGPILNGVFLISGLVAIPFLKRFGAQFSLGRHLALTLGAPIAAVAADLFIILSMGLHRC